jgi:copper chaperone CopZ
MKKVFKIEGIDCANCAARVERNLNVIAGTTCTINFMAERLTIETAESNWDNAYAEVVATLKRLNADYIIKEGK